MDNKATLYRGESFTIGLRFNPEYGTNRIEALELLIGRDIVGQFPGAITNDNGVYRIELSSEDTYALPRLYAGSRKITLHLQDSQFGVIKSVVAEIDIVESNSRTTSPAINNGYNLTIVANVDEYNIVADAWLASVYVANGGGNTGNGNDGKSAYQIAVDNGFTGTAQEWLISLKGEQGEPGAKGEQGEPGAKGDPGQSITLVQVTDESTAIADSTTNPNYVYWW